MENPAEQLRLAIENLINVKLQDILTHGNGLDRFAAHRSNGVASHAIREAENQLQSILSKVLPRPGQGQTRERLRRPAHQAHASLQPPTVGRQAPG